MSKPYQSKELLKTANVQSRLDQLENSSVNRTGQDVRSYTENGDRRLRAVKTKPVTHRQRLFKIRMKPLPSASCIYALVRDTVEKPIDDKNLPKGKLVFEIKDRSFETVTAETRRRSKELGRVRIKDWRDFGSI